MFWKYIGSICEYKVNTCGFLGVFETCWYLDKIIVIRNGKMSSSFVGTLKKRDPTSCPGTVPVKNWASLTRYSQIQHKTRR